MLEPPQPVRTTVHARLILGCAAIAASWKHYRETALQCALIYRMVGLMANRSFCLVLMMVPRSKFREFVGV